MANNCIKKVIFKNRPPFTDFASKINNTQVDNAKKIDAAMFMYNLIAIIIQKHREAYDNIAKMDQV